LDEDPEIDPGQEEALELCEDTNDDDVKEVKEKDNKEENVISQPPTSQQPSHHPQLQIRRDLLAKPSTITSSTSIEHYSFLGTFRKRALDADMPLPTNLSGRNSPRMRLPPHLGIPIPPSSLLKPPPPDILSPIPGPSSHGSSMLLNLSAPKPPNIPSTSTYTETNPNIINDLSMKKDDNILQRPSSSNNNANNNNNGHNNPPKKTGFTIEELMRR